MTERLRRIYADASNLEIQAGFGQGSESYEPETWEVLVEEGRRRQLAVEPTTAVDVVEIEPHMLAMSIFEPEEWVNATKASQRPLRRLRRAWTLTCVGTFVMLASLVIARHGGGITILVGFGAIGVGLYRMFVSMRGL
jgi:hypothetical protein